MKFGLPTTGLRDENLTFAMKFNTVLALQVNQVATVRRAKTKNQEKPSPLNVLLMHHMRYSQMHHTGTVLHVSQSVSISSPSLGVPPAAAASAAGAPPSVSIASPALSAASGAGLAGEGAAGLGRVMMGLQNLEEEHTHTHTHTPHTHTPNEGGREGKRMVRKGVRNRRMKEKGKQGTEKGQSRQALQMWVEHQFGYRTSVQSQHHNHTWHHCRICEYHPGNLSQII